ncbi:tripartite tricarboxylate transporter substrate binding protein [Cupriavidus necator]|uniref:Bug family tripartite tricarboxylate transporter substrate binding protein n=1 Tax=Cupriavidus necator TaxID=106590 RepID=UPI0039C38DFD
MKIKSTSRRRVTLGLMGASVAGILPSMVRAESGYPARPIRVVIGFAAGGGADAVARLICTSMSADLKQPMVIENRPGANGNIAADVVTKATNDGYTILYNTSSLVISPHLYTSLPYDIKRDLLPVAEVAAIPLVLVVSPRLGVKSMQEFVANLKANPRKLNYGSSGTGNITHLSAAEFLRQVGAKASHVPYKSEAPAVTDLLGGHIDFYIGNANTLIPHVADKKLTALAVTSLQRLPSLPDVPTLDQTVAKGLEMVAWSGFMVPKGTPDAVIAKLASTAERVLKTQTLRSRIEETGAMVRWAGTSEYGRILESETDRWGKAVKASGVRPE